MTMPAKTDEPISIDKVKREKKKAPIKLKDEEMRQIEILSGLGLSIENISLAVGYSEHMLRKIAKENVKVDEAIKRGRAKAGSKVAQTAYELAVSGKFPVMTMFWLKCQQKWKETHVEEIHTKKEVIFKTRIGPKGQIISNQEESEL